MTNSTTSQKAPYKVKVEKGKTYFWCSCGLSFKQPFCDGSHKKEGRYKSLKYLANDKKINSSEIEYLINCVNLYFVKQISEKDIIETFSGIRPLIDNQKNNISKITRDFYLDLNTENNQAPLLNIYGGKLTTYRKLAEKVIASLNCYLPKIQNDWTHKNQLNRL